MRKKRLQFDMAISEEDRRIICELRDEFAVNLSGFFKISMREHLRCLRRIRSKAK